MNSQEVWSALDTRASFYRPPGPRHWWAAFIITVDVRPSAPERGRTGITTLPLSIRTIHFSFSLSIIESVLVSSVCLCVRCVCVCNYLCIFPTVYAALLFFSFLEQPTPFLGYKHPRISLVLLFTSPKKSFYMGLMSEKTSWIKK